MKLKIKNYNKIIGGKLRDDTEWIIRDVVESDEYYGFWCEIPTSPGFSTNVRLIRDGILEHGEWKYRFWRPANWSGYSQVTADWFADMDNAKYIVSMELEKTYIK